MRVKYNTFEDKNNTDSMSLYLLDSIEYFNSTFLKRIDIFI